MAEPVVAIAECGCYEYAAVEEALARALELLPELENTLTADRHILLKVDLEVLRHRDPPLIVHPTVVKAVAHAIARRGTHVSIGDASAAASWPLWRRIRQVLLQKLEGKIRGKTYRELLDTYEKLMNVKVFEELNRMELPGVEQPLIEVAELGLESEVDIYRHCGMLDVAAETGAELSYFEIEEFIDCPSRTAAFLKQVPVAEAVHRADHVISIPRLRVHGHNSIAGAVANMFGIVPTAVREPYTITSTISGMRSLMHVDVFSTVDPPPLAISDAVTAIRPDRRTVDTGLIVAGCDCVAHDAVLAAIAGLEPMDDMVIRAAHEAGLGQGLLENIEIRGVPLEKARTALCA